MTISSKQSVRHLKNKMTDDGIRYPFLDLKAADACYRDRLVDAAARVIAGGHYIGGEENEAFERDLAGLCKAPHAVGVSNGLDALRLIFIALINLGRLRKGDAVIVPANTYIASVLAVTDAGLIPVLVDPDPATMNLSAKGIEQSMTDRVRAVLSVHLYGRVCWDNMMAKVVRDNGLIVVEDAAQSIGARARCRGLFESDMAGALGHAGAFSFYPTKNIGALGDAGAVVTHDAALAAAVSALANYGSDRRYHNIYAGFNCRLDPIQAAMLRVKMTDLDDICRRRRLRADAYSRNISNPLVETPLRPECASECVWHQYVIRVRGGMRDTLRQYLLEHGVATDIHYPVPPHRQPCYANLPHGRLPITEKMASEIVSLPIGDPLDVDDIMEISGIINSFFTQHTNG